MDPARPLPRVSYPSVRLIPLADPARAPSEPVSAVRVRQALALPFGWRWPKRTAQKACLAAFLVLLGVGVAWRYRVATRTPLNVARARLGAISERIPSVASGRVSAERELSLRSEFGTRVMVVYKRPGDRVSAGDALVSLELEQAQNAVRAAEQALITAQAISAEARIHADLARKRDRRNARLFAGGAAPAADAETAHVESLLAAQAARIADSRAKEQDESLRAARLALSHGDVRAPFDGIVLTVPVEVGQTVLAGAALVSVADVSSLHVAAAIDEADLNRVRLGMPVELSFEAEKGKIYRKSVTELDPSVTSNERGARVVGVKIALEPGSNLRVGMSAQVDIVTAERTRALLVPNSALLGTGTEREVLLVRDGASVRRSVSVGISSWDAVEVTRGLTAGELLVLNPNASEGDSPTASSAPAAQK